jgi:hypothetical protein
MRRLYYSFEANAFVCVSVMIRVVSEHLSLDVSRVVVTSSARIQTVFNPNEIWGKIVPTCGGSWDKWVR